MTGATESRLAIRIPISDIASVSSRARNGSPLFVVTLKNLRKGITPSLAMACSSLGAPENRLTVYFYQGSYRQVLVKFNDFSRTSKTFLLFSRTENL